jgi:patatin-like phospholipase/acyl hydrolase
MRRRIILSIDGGGIRGIIPIAILKRLNDLMKYQLQSRIDLYAGTSTGSLIGGALMLKTELGYIYSINDILNLYSFRSRSIFKVEEGITQNPLKFIMDKTFQNVMVKDQEHDFLFTTEDNTDSSLHTISNVDDSYNDSKLSEILLACSAIKGYFDPVIINGKALSDGVTVMKNPSLIALEHYKAMYPNDEMIVLSFGTGDIGKFYDDQIEKDVEGIHQSLEEMSKTQENLKYYRIQPAIKHANHEMNDTSPENIENLLIDAQSYINSNFDYLDKIIYDLRKVNYDSKKQAIG